jgi:hypothetical protein
MKRLAISLVFILFAAPAFSAIITVDDTGAAPSTNVVIQQLTQDGVGDMRRTSDVTTSWRDFVQTFTAPSNFTLDKISVLIGQDVPFPTNGQVLKIDLFSTASLGTPSGTSLLSGGETGTTPSYTSNTERWMTFDIADTALTSSGLYGFRIGFNATGSTNRLGGGTNDFGGVYYSGENPYADGRIFRITGGSTITAGYENRDMGFVLQGVVPEPQSFLLAGLGVLGMAACGLRRRVG